ncbi:MAG TPA: uroporphyrinogen decarboxylase family protein [Methanomassiliicoccales archaeon]
MKERLLTALDRGVVDRAPCVSPGQTAIADLQRSVGAEWPLAHTNAELMATLALASVTLGGQEGARVPFETTMDASAFGASVEMGAILRHPYVSGHPLVDQEAVDRAMVPNPREDGRAPVVLEAVHRLKSERVPVLCAVTAPFTLACFLRGERDTLMDIIINPAFLGNVLKLAERWAVTFIHEAVEAGADVIVLEDTWASGEILSRQQYLDNALPGEQTLAREVHEMGARSILHHCGHPGCNFDLMANSGADGLTIHQTMGVREAKEQLSGRCAAVGNLDPLSILRLEPNEIFDLSTRCLAEGIDVLAPACGLDPATPLLNMRAMADAANGSTH